MATLSVPQALKLLQLEPGASKKQIRAAYKRLALQLHPDKQQQSADATAAFTLLSAAYSLLVRGNNTYVLHEQFQQEAELPPFETAYATGSLFSEQFVDEAVLKGLCPADIVTLQQLSSAASEGQLAEHLAANPPSHAEEQLWSQVYTRLQLRQHAKQQRTQQQQHQQQHQQHGVCFGELLSDLLLRPSGPLFVEEEDSSDAEDLEAAPVVSSNEQQAQQPVCLQHQPHHHQQLLSKQHQPHHHQQLLSKQQQQQQQRPHQQRSVYNSQPQQQQHSRSAGASKPINQLQAVQDPCRQAPAQQQQLLGLQQVKQLQQQQPQQQQDVKGRCPPTGKKLRHGWGFYWMWLRRVLLAKALLSVLSSSLRDKLHEHHFPQPLPL